MIEQFDSDCETSDCPHPVFVPEGESGPAQTHVDDYSIIPINAPEVSTPNIPFVEFDDAPVASDCASVADSCNPDEPDPEDLCQSKQIWENQSGHLHRTDRVIWSFGPKQIPIFATILFHTKLKSNQCYNLSNEVGDSICL